MTSNVACTVDQRRLPRIPHCLSASSDSLYLQLNPTIWTISYLRKPTNCTISLQEWHFPAPLRHIEKQQFYWNWATLALQSSSLQSRKFNIDKPPKGVQEPECRSVLRKESQRISKIGVEPKGVRKWGGFGVKTHPVNLLCCKNVITYAKEFVYVFVHFLLVWCQLNAKTTEWFCMKISRNTINGPKRNNYILMGIWVIACIQEPSHHSLQTFRRLRIFMLVLRDSSLYS